MGEGPDPAPIVPDYDDSSCGGVDLELSLGEVKGNGKMKGGGKRGNRRIVVGINNEIERNGKRNK